jgi:hypothetical protein
MYHSGKIATIITTGIVDNFYAINPVLKKSSTDGKQYLIIYESLEGSVIGHEIIVGNIAC